MSEANPLFRAFPVLAGRVPWTQLTDGPTPVERIQDVPPGFRGELWVKRDDLSSPHYGGNKVRKLEYLLAAAKAEGARRVITSGVVGSHHALATCVHGRRLGLPTTLMVAPQPMTEHAKEVAALNEACADRIVRCRSFATMPFVEPAVRRRHRDEAPYVVPPGGSDPLGALGYVGGALELAEQVRAGIAPRPDVIRVAAGTLGTVAGIAVGAALTGVAEQVVGVRIVPSIVANEVMLGRLVEGAIALLRDAGANVPDARLVMDLVELEPGYLGAGYGEPTEAGARATEWFAARGLALDPSYTAKTGAAMLDALEAEPDAVHLFWHTLSAVTPHAPPVMGSSGQSAGRTEPTGGEGRA